MKKVLFLMSAVLILGCHKQPADQIRLTGTITNADTLVIKFVEGQKTDTLIKAANGSFTFEKISPKPVSGYLNVGKKYLMVYLLPGKDLNVSVDLSRWDSTLQFTGSLKPVADYMHEKNLITRRWSKGFAATILKEPATYRVSRDSLDKAYTLLYKKYSGMKGFDTRFATREELVLQFDRVLDLKNYAMMNKYYSKKDTVILPNNWNDFEKGIVLNNPALLEVSSAMQYLTTYIGESAQKESGLKGDLWGNPKYLAAKFSIIRKTFQDPVMAGTFMFNDLGQQIDGNSTKGIDAQMNEYFALAKNQEQVTEIKKKAAEWDAIMPGKLAPDFTVVDITGKEFSLSQFKGKYVFIDFWATWCGPCKQEIPFIKKLYADFKNKNIVIMSISIDQDKKAWEKMVTEEGFAWLQLHDGKKMSDKYVVRYIPSFILIDQEGKIIDSRAPNPSDPKLRQLISTLKGL